MFSRLSPPFLLGCLVLSLLSPAHAGLSKITVKDRSLELTAGLLRRTINVEKGNIRTTSLRIGDCEILGPPAREFSVRFQFANPNQRPLGLRPGQGGIIDARRVYSSSMDVLLDTETSPSSQAPRWVDPLEIEASRYYTAFGDVRSSVSATRGASRLGLEARGIARRPLEGVTITLFYEVYDEFPVVRKWVRITNGGSRWIKIDRLVIEDLALGAIYRNQTPLTPPENGAGSSVIAFSAPDGSAGIIAASEIPSALRAISSQGAMGYASDLFEWVLGPSESFESEPVFLYAFSGPVQKTPSAISTPLDRTVETSYMKFLKERIGLASNGAPLYAPQWMTWAIFEHRIDDALVRRQAELAARAGFVQVLLDDGWQRDRLGTEIDTVKFPDFADTCRFVTSKGLSLGLWVSCIRTTDSKDLQAIPDARSLPLFLRQAGFGMSFASPWRHYYAKDLVEVGRRFGVTYFKQDFTNIKSGDFAEGHESRTRRESLLRGLRGLLEAQRLIRAQAPEIVTEITHEIYWGTPGVPCDLAALKHAVQYHIPPNDCRGTRSDALNLNSVQHRAELIAGCYVARAQFYAHRGLPLHRLELWGAATHSVDGSMTPQVQDRQVCSWLMGAPLTFSGDLRTLSDENIAHYRRRFDLLARLQRQYDIYSHFQFSGVPAPTDTDWHWWGKLNEEGRGAVIVLRGSGGADRRAVNIPWVAPERKYKVRALFAERDLGTFTGGELIAGKMHVALPSFGQEILEIS